MKSQTVFVVDDDCDLRDSVQLLLKTVGYQVEAYPTAEDFVSAYTTTRPGCLILDIRMPGKSGLELYEHLVRSSRRIPVIFITAHADVSTAVHAMKSGAIEFLEKPFPSERLLELVSRALQVDETWRSSEARYQQLNQAVEKLSLTDRETLEMILEGGTNKAMAARLFISERAVELRRQRLMQRLNVRSVPELLELTITHRVLAEVRQLDEQWPYRFG